MELALQKQRRSRIEEVPAWLLAHVTSGLSIRDTVRLTCCSRALHAFDWRRFALWREWTLGARQMTTWFAGGRIHAPLEKLTWTNGVLANDDEKALAAVATCFASAAPTLKTLILRRDMNDLKFIGASSSSWPPWPGLTTAAATLSCLTTLELFNLNVDHMHSLLPQLPASLTALTLKSSNVRTSRELLAPWAKQEAFRQLQQLRLCTRDSDPWFISELPSLTDLRWRRTWLGRSPAVPPNLQLLLEALPRSKMTRLVVEDPTPPFGDDVPRERLLPSALAGFTALRELSLPHSSTVRLHDLVACLAEAPLQSLVMARAPRHRAAAGADEGVAVPDPEHTATLRFLSLWPELHTCQVWPPNDDKDGGYLDKVAWATFLQRHPRLRYAPIALLGGNPVHDTGLVAA